MEFFEMVLKNDNVVDYYGNLYWVKDPIIVMKRDGSSISKIGEKIIADVKARYGYELLGNNHCFQVISSKWSSFSMVFTKDELVIGYGIIEKCLAD